MLRTTVPTLTTRQEIDNELPYTRMMIVTLRNGTKRGIELPSDDIQTDIKVTSIKQPQSSCFCLRQKHYA